MSKLKLDAEALLAKNPGVDRKIFEENQAKASEAKRVIPPNKTDGTVTLPYGGRRIVSDDRGDGPLDAPQNPALKVRYGNA